MLRCAELRELQRVPAAFGHADALVHILLGHAIQGALLGYNSANIILTPECVRGETRLGLPDEMFDAVYLARLRLESMGYACDTAQEEDGLHFLVVWWEVCDSEDAGDENTFWAFV